MKRIEEVINAKADLIAGKGASEELIDSAERQLNVVFAPEYREYLLHFGVVSFDGREFTGITPVERVDVIAVTKEERSRVPGKRDHIYVVEQTNMDDVVFWQDEKGTIYRTYGNEDPEKICDSLGEFLSE